MFRTKSRYTPALSASAPRVRWEWVERAMGTGPRGLARAMELEMVAPLPWPQRDQSTGIFLYIL